MRPFGTAYHISLPCARYPQRQGLMFITEETYHHILPLTWATVAEYQ